MIFIIPIILGAAALASATTGLVKGVDGLSKLSEAEKIGKKSQEKYERTRHSVEDELQQTQDMAKAYGELQIRVKIETIGRFVKFIEQIGQHASQKDIDFLDGIDGISPQQLQDYRSATLEAQKLASGAVQAMGTAYATGQGMVALIGLFGTASTGTAISGLSGAAAWNATLAWLGGGSLATGGGGMALGSLVLGGITVGPALMVGGFVLGSQGEKALTKAQKYSAEANIEIAKLDTFKDFLQQVQTRINELDKLVESLDEKAIEGIEELELIYASAFEKLVLSRKAISRRRERWVQAQKQDSCQSKSLFERAKSLGLEIKNDLKVLEASTTHRKDQTRSILDERDIPKFQKVALLVKSLAEILKTPILDESGELNADTGMLKAKYQAIGN